MFPVSLCVEIVDICVAVLPVFGYFFLFYLCSVQCRVKALVNFSLISDGSNSSIRFENLSMFKFDGKF